MPLCFGSYNFFLPQRHQDTKRHQEGYFVSLGVLVVEKSFPIGGAPRLHGSVPVGSRDFLAGSAPIGSQPLCQIRFSCLLRSRDHSTLPLGRFAATVQFRQGQATFSP